MVREKVDKRQKEQRTRHMESVCVFGVYERERERGASRQTSFSTPDHSKFLTYHHCSLEYDDDEPRTRRPIIGF